MSARKWMDDAPTIVLLSQRTVTARKDHVCASCRETIPIGMRHAVCAYIEDGEFVQRRTHGHGYPTCPRDIAEEKRFAEAEAETLRPIHNSGRGF